ncbi:hypothetical protein F511_47471 [Dorcoceras hygrometricum]|uniref:Uncharacterized protein n=1 Tax=Dorcoceras hygrometricum TaxID=472368 RepID=A0A2Z6ZXD9_9LAMI|nr:hypothetical protein F511_47471 [Dorcoceras hygrometricum]
MRLLTRLKTRSLRLSKRLLSLRGTTSGTLLRLTSRPPSNRRTRSSKSVPADHKGDRVLELLDTAKSHASLRTDYRIRLPNRYQNHCQNQSSLIQKNSNGPSS